MRGELLGTAPPSHTRRRAEDHGAGGCFPYSPPLRAPAPSPRLGGPGAERRNARPECAIGDPAEYRLPGWRIGGVKERRGKLAKKVGYGSSVLSPPPCFFWERGRGRAQGADGHQRPTISP